jgi:hypothetical protein
MDNRDHWTAEDWQREAERIERAKPLHRKLLSAARQIVAAPLVLLFGRKFSG